MAFSRNKAIEEKYDTRLIQSSYLSWGKYTPILNALNIIESPNQFNLNSLRLSCRERFILNINLSLYDLHYDLTDDEREYLQDAVEVIKQEKIRIEEISKKIRFSNFNILDVVDEFYKIKNDPRALSSHMFVEFEHGWYARYRHFVLCFIKKTNASMAQDYFSLFKETILFCVESKDFSDEELKGLYDLGSICSVIMMDEGGHRHHISSDSFFLNFERKMNVLDWKLTPNKRSIIYIEDETRKLIRLKIKSLLKKIDCHKHEIITYMNYGIKADLIEFNLNIICQYCEKLIDGLLFDEHNEHLQAIYSIKLFIQGCKNRIESITGLMSLDNELYNCIYKIQRNKYLYKIESSRTLFNETNIAAIYKELLAANNKNPTLSYTQEELNGNGRTDIQVNYRNNPVAIIETKLLKKGHENRTDEIRKGLDQLYERYSRNHYRILEHNILLKLVLFCIDTNMENLVKSISNAINEHERRVGIKFHAIDGFRRDTIRLKLLESNERLRTRVEFIDIIIVRLEDKYDKDRLAKKDFAYRKTKNN
ncbi:hypothetical protein KKJ13_11900 [Xenorhabdus bovienii]|uniref:hypothetical protein n=1 Tax=Xenorhabdus bovienii TaxID=40576 RepID=UPI0023B277E8|nr:hypothetical protein [Xenorhabdus bovienii]MDE9442292.1 hypothetical protein [Xenorhabdus bovienii]